MEKEVTELKTERDQSHQPKDSLFTHMTEIVDSVSASAPLPAAVSPRKLLYIERNYRPLSSLPVSKLVCRTNRHRINWRLLIPLVLDLHRQRDQMVAIKLTLLLLIWMILSWWRYHLLVLPPDLELRRHLRDLHQYHFPRRSLLSHQSSTSTSREPIANIHGGFIW